MRMYILCAALAIFAASAADLTNAYPAQLENSGGVENGQMVLTAEQLVFVTGDRSFAVPYTDVRALHSENGKLTIAIRRPNRTLRVMDVQQPDLIAMRIGLLIDRDR